MVKIFTPIPKSNTINNAEFLRPRLQSLKGKRIALLSNKKANAAEVLMKAGELLRTKCGIIGFDFFEKDNASYPAPERIIDEILKDKYDAAVVSLGD
ncbi:hypothetical protein AA0X95_17095 [Bacillus sp. 1P10SD]|uniref:UGSC family (seleno)protein n=1 Tax=Bacillus sp. 1P10SD TaxID=3132265 RepID=UPI0039A771CA